MAVEAALAAGASYADARVVHRRSQHVSTKNGRVENVRDVESEGIGVRVLAGGAWGFACDRRLSDAGARSAAMRATGFARAAPGVHDRQLAPLAAKSGVYRTPMERDPFAVGLAEKVDHCLRADQALAHADVKVTQAFVRAQREHKFLVSSEGSDVEQELVECGGGIDALAARDGLFQVRSYPSAHGGWSSQAGWEYVEGLGLEREAPRVGEQAAAVLQADPCPAAVTTIVVDAEQVALPVHESVGHPIELDRVYGTEASYAGTSFLTLDKRGCYRYGSDAVTIAADATIPGALGTFGFDDEGVPAQRTVIVDRGIFK